MKSEIPVEALRVSVVIVNWNDGAHLVDCLASLAQQPGLLEVIVVDNGSSDGSLARLRTYNERLKLIANETNQGISVARNQGASAASGDVLLFLDPDAKISTGGVLALAEALRARPGVAGPVLDERGTRSYGCRLDILGFGLPLEQPDSHPMFVKGCAFATHRDLWERLGGVDDRYFFVMDEVDYCWRVLLSGGDISIASNVVVIHAGGSSTPGGYEINGGFETSRFRLKYREQNTLATFLKCAPAGWLPWLVPLVVSKTLATALVAAALGKPRIGLDLLGSLAWNVAQMGNTLKRRDCVPHTRWADRRAAVRISKRVTLFGLIRRAGLPRFVD